MREDVSISQSIVSFRSVRKSGDDGTTILRGLSLDVRRFELLTLMGPSGSGKTAALRMLAGLDLPDAGMILYNDEDIARMPRHRRGLALVPQDYALFPYMTVGENVAFHLTELGVPPAEQAERVAHVLDRMGLSGFAGRRPVTLSGGQRQRVALARALVWNPSLLLLDEPFGSLDRPLREALQSELRARPGLTTIHVTQDLMLAFALSDRIAVLRDGTVAQVATPTDLYQRPATAWVAGFLGQNNALSGRVIAELDDLIQVQLADGSIVEARTGEAMELGQACTVFIRPERIAIASGDLGDGALAATLEAVTFAGDHLHLALRVGDTRVIVKRPAGAGLDRAEPGTVMSMAWQAHHAMAFADQGS